jgi:septal ring factor EnvC (AmiA/AmiB activator)
VHIGTVRALRRETHKLAQLRLSAQAYRQEIAALVQKADAQKAAQEVQKKARLSVLARLEGRIAAERQEAVRLGRDDLRMTRLIKALQKTVAQQAEVRRLANAARQQPPAQPQADTPLTPTSAQSQANAPLKPAAVPHQARPARKSTEQTDHVNEGVSRPQAVQPVPADAVDSDTSKQALSWAQGLRPGLPMPVQNATLQGRFGVSRPDDKGVWRGVVLRAAEGTPVQVIAQGMVVYASWLRGFGNLIIVDHGHHYMSVYAYNQSLLKQVGDHVVTGETVATVGATGGQVESGLYFEIRYGGVPLDPQQWLVP